MLDVLNICHIFIQSKLVPGRCVWCHHLYSFIELTLITVSSFGYKQQVAIKFCKLIPCNNNIKSLFTLAIISSVLFNSLVSQCLNLPHLYSRPEKRRCLTKYMSTFF